MRKTSKVLSVNFLKHFCLKTSKQAFSQKIIQVDCKTLCCYNLCKKSEKISRVDFSKNLKNLFMGPFGTKTRENFQKS